LIQNHIQYGITKRARDKFLVSIRAFDLSRILPDQDGHILAEAEFAALHSELEVLRKQIDEYEKRDFTMVEEGDVIQVLPECSMDKMWWGCLVVVDEVRDWGYLGYVLVPKRKGAEPGQAYLRVQKSDCIEVGVVACHVGVDGMSKDTKIGGPEFISRLQNVHHDAALAIHGRGPVVVLCRKCNRNFCLSVEAIAGYLRTGWPKCCNEIMYLQIEKDRH